jgi:NIMA (never in mitosis gene a)-related kinase 1/4/5
MSPEVLNDENYNAKVDVWALGVILYQLTRLSQAKTLEETLPFGNPRSAKYLDNARKGKYPDVSRNYPVESKIIARCLHPDPDERASVEELLNMPEIAEHYDRLFSITQQAN